LTFWAWQDLLKNQKDSPYVDWYWVDQFDDQSTEENEFEYRGWAGVKDLPEIKETEFIDHSDRVVPAEGNILSEEVRNHIFAVTRRWLDPNGDGDPSDGVDGYRLDVAAEVPFGFWREFRKVVREVNPQAYLLGEVWWEKWPDELLDPYSFVKGDVFDSPMNYRWYRAARHFFGQAPDEIPVSEFVDSLQSFQANLRRQSNYAMMNLVSSHDVPRVLTSLFNKNKYKYYSSPGADNNYKIHRPDSITFQTFRLLLAHQFTYVGAPAIWAGDEMGMWGADDPSCRKPLLWPDYEFDNEVAHPLGKERPEDEVKFNQGLYAYYQKLINIRKAHPVLSQGEMEYVKMDDAKEILAYSRFDQDPGKQEILVVF
ncbi:MAG: alpha-amylase family glycosyl hydrolase, partial [Bacteroidota bacterium]